jgi:ABC-type dipeptide/oligopeptide/nickel transport system permease subunit
MRVRSDATTIEHVGVPAALAAGTIAAPLRKRRLRLLPALPLAILALLALVAIAAPLITPYDPVKHAVASRMLPPFWLPKGSIEHLLGTDRFGRDIFTRLIYGARSSLLIVVVSSFIALTIGAGVGILAGYAGGKIDAVLSRLVDVMLAVPSVLVALAIAVALGPSFWNVVLILGFLIWPNIARLIRGEALAIRQLDFAQYSAAIGVPRWIILLRHVLPNVLPTLLVAVTLETANIILTEASLSFLGAGVPPPTPSWGAMIDEGRALIKTGWWIALFPGLMIAVTVLCLNSVGDWLRDHSDPSTREAS